MTKDRAHMHLEPSSLCSTATRPTAFPKVVNNIRAVSLSQAPSRATSM